MEEANTAEKLAVTFWHVIHSRKCRARDHDGAPCTGEPMMKARTKGTGSSLRKGYFITCSAWTRKFREGHLTCSIPDNVDEDLLAKLFNNQSLDGFNSAPGCSRIIPAHVGGKVPKCRYPHNADGQPSTVVRHKCPASRVIYVPLDPKIRMACVVPNLVPHNHPILPAVKASHDIKALFNNCIDAVGVVGAT
ncbi:hypothetical protein H0H92_015221, partial [Tricholoma furcatifolium]